MTRVLTALLLAALVLLPVPAGAAGAPADPATSRVLSPGVVADHLAEAPLYVHPDRFGAADGETALSREQSRELNLRVAEEVPHLYVAVTPWGDEPLSMGTALANRAGLEGTFLVVGEGPTIVAVHSAADEIPGPAPETVRMAVELVNERSDLARADLYDRLGVLVDLVTDEESTARAHEAMTSGRSTARFPFPVWTVIPGFLAVLLVAGATAWVLRRRALRPLRVAPLTEAVADTVDSSVREHEHRELVRVLPSYGRRAARFEGPERRTADALAAYEAAARVLDSATDASDLVGVRVLLDHCEAALTGAAAPRHCFFDPRHRGQTRPVRLRVTASPRAVSVPACAECRADVRAHRVPASVPDSSQGQPVPYYSVPSERSVWAATGYGTLAPDLVNRVLGGGVRG
ncbi:hypothetical protein ABZ635_26885 [Nocardiopsis sp. NPDC007018]|uniref:hypothetical protein n=1 Tax=Nocardiopsis sp. NPDC007018 TaxID=3155721 RepID=UPI0033CCA8F4